MNQVIYNGVTYNYDAVKSSIQEIKKTLDREIESEAIECYIKSNGEDTFDFSNGVYNYNSILRQLRCFIIEGDPFLFKLTDYNEADLLKIAKGILENK